MPTPTTNRTTILLDPSALKESSCILRLHNILVSGYRKEGGNFNDIEFGSAFHAYRRTFDTLSHDRDFKAKFDDSQERETFTQILAVKAGLDYWDKVPRVTKWNKKYLDRKFLENTLREYYNYYKLHGDEYEVVTIGGKPLVELRIPYPYYVTPEGDVEVILCGTIDRIIRHRSLGFYASEDYKTTALWDKSKFFTAYQLSTQMLAYKFMIREYAKLYPASVLDSVASNLKCVINGIFHSANGVMFERSEPYNFSDDKLAEFEIGLMRVVERLVEVVREPNKLYREGMLNSSCEKVYGACGFAEACAAESEEERRFIMNEKFVRVPYSPLSHGELKSTELITKL